METIKLKVTGGRHAYATKVEDQDGKILPVSSLKWEMDLNKRLPDGRRDPGALHCTAEILTHEFVYEDDFHLVVERVYRTEDFLAQFDNQQESKE